MIDESKIRVWKIGEGTFVSDDSGKTYRVQGYGSMKDNVFEPKEITVERGKTITFVAKNEGTVVHNMMIQSSATEGKDFISTAMVNSGEESKFTATFTKAGVVKFICAYHQPDMSGTITVK